MVRHRAAPPTGTPASRGRVVSTATCTSRAPPGTTGSASRRCRSATRASGAGRAAAVRMAPPDPPGVHCRVSGRQASSSARSRVPRAHPPVTRPSFATPESARDRHPVVGAAPRTAPYLASCSAGCTPARARAGARLVDTRGPCPVRRHDHLGDGAPVPHKHSGGISANSSIARADSLSPVRKAAEFVRVTQCRHTGDDRSAPLSPGRAGPAGAGGARRSRLALPGCTDSRGTHRPQRPSRRRIGRGRARSRHRRPPRLRRVDAGGSPGTAWTTRRLDSQWVAFMAEHAVPDECALRRR